MQNLRAHNGHGPGALEFWSVSWTGNQSNSSGIRGHIRSTSRTLTSMEVEAETLSKRQWGHSCILTYPGQPWRNIVNKGLSSAKRSTYALPNLSQIRSITLGERTTLLAISTVLTALPLHHFAILASKWFSCSCVWSHLISFCLRQTVQFNLVTPW